MPDWYRERKPIKITNIDDDYGKITNIDDDYIYFVLNSE